MEPTQRAAGTRRAGCAGGLLGWADEDPRRALSVNAAPLITPPSVPQKARNAKIRTQFPFLAREVALSSKPSYSRPGWIDERLSHKRPRRWAGAPIKKESPAVNIMNVATLLKAV